MRNRIRAAAIMLTAAAAFSACAPDPTPTPSETAAGIAAPTRTSSPSPSSAPSQTRSTAPTEPSFMTGEEAAGICRRMHAGGDPSVTIDGPARIEARSIDPKWLVIFPASNQYGRANVVCILGGDPTAPDVVVGGAETSPLTDEDIREQLESNAMYEL